MAGTSGVGQACHYASLASERLAGLHAIYRMPKPIFRRAVASVRDGDVVDVVELAAEDWARDVLDEGMSARRQGVVESANTLDEEGLDGIDRVAVLVVE